jgi:hypothetical protein
MRVMRIVGALVACSMFLALAPGAFAREPAWNINPGVSPKNLPPGGKGVIHAVVANFGDANAEGSAIVIHDELPAGLTATAISVEAGYQSSGYGAVGTCTLATVTCEYTQPLPPYGHLYLVIEVTVAEGAVSGALNRTTVSGGGAATASLSNPVTVSAAPVAFGVESFSIVPENEDGSIDDQAGSHPFQLTTTIGLNQNAKGESVAYEKDLHFLLPPGLIGDPQVAAQCTGEQFSAFNDENGTNGCPANSATQPQRISEMRRLLQRISVRRGLSSQEV